MISSDTDTRRINIEDASQVGFDAFAITGFNRYLEFGTLIINPTTNLLPDTIYTIQIAYGALVDTVGNALGGFNDIAVSTVDSTPILLRSTPFDDSTGFKADGVFLLHFDETVVAGSGEIVVSSDTDTRIIDIDDTSQVTFDNNGLVSINPQEDLIPNTVYTLQVPDGTVVDIDDNIFINFNPITFTAVAAGSFPQLIFSNPINGSSEFPVNDNIELRFNETVKAGIGNIVISSDSDVRTIAINDTSQVIFNVGNTVIIDPTDDLIPGVSYTVQINSGAIIDQPGNAYSGFDNAVISTVEAVETAETKFSPLFGPIVIGVGSSPKSDENIVLGFFDDVIAGNGDIVISNGSDIRAIVIDDASQVTFNIDTDIRGAFSDTATIVTIDPKEDLIPDTTYNVQRNSAILRKEVGKAGNASWF